MLRDTNEQRDRFLLMAKNFLKNYTEKDIFNQIVGNIRDSMKEDIERFVKENDFSDISVDEFELFVVAGVINVFVDVCRDILNSEERSKFVVFGN